MDAEINTERSTVLLAVVTLVIVGLGLVLGMWQVFNRQEEAMQEHLLLTSRAVLKAVESSLRRGHGLNPDKPLEFNPETESFFNELEQSGDVLFVSLVGVGGEKIITSSGPSAIDLTFSKEALEQMKETGEWGGIVNIGDKNTYVYARRLSSRLFMHGGAYFQNQAALNPPYLVVALDIAKHMTVYKSFKQNLQFQTVYILLSAMALWILSNSFLKRRVLAGRAVVLERFQAKLLDNLPDGLILLGEGGKIEAANPAAHRILQIFPGSLVGKFFNILPKEIIDCLGEDYLSGKEKLALGGWKYCHFGGAYLEVLLLFFWDGKSENEEKLIIIRDRTEIRELEKNLGEAEKLAAVGTLAAGMAHEIRNPLSALRGFAQYFAKKFAGQKPEEVYAQTMVKESDRLNRVITDLLDLARPAPVQPKIINLPKFINELKNLINFDLEEKKATLHCEIEGEEIYADEDALKQALLNLILNSLESFDSTINSAKEQNREIGLLAHLGENGIWLTVKDHGSGMSDKEKEQAFEPFFTAKPRGTGLGLALVHRTVREHGGKINLESTLGKGTTISLFFPNYTPRIN